MAVGIFRKVLDKVGSVLKFVKEHLPLVSKLAFAAAPILTTVNPALGAGAAAVGAGAAGVNKFLSGFDGLANPPQGNESNGLDVDFNNDVSPYIKFKRNI